MANTGYITSSGIQQVFTNGPYSGSLVTSSYASGSTLFGPTIDFKQSFISGTLDYLLPCPGLSYYRYYEDLITCPINGCSPPVLNTAYPQICTPYNDSYIVQYNSSSANALYTVVEYSTHKRFLTNTGSVIYNNSVSPHLAIDVSTLPLQPTAFTIVYFQAYNSCSSGVTSSYSNVLSASCGAVIDDDPTPTVQPFFVSITNLINQPLYYKREGSTQYVLLVNENITFDFIGDTYNLEFSTYFSPYAFIFNSVRVDIDGIGFNDGDVSLTTTSPFGDNSLINTYPNSHNFTSDSNTTTTDLTLSIDKSTFPYGGNLQLTFSPIFIDPFNSL
jgi:hypothetical protein